ncbi:MAG: SLBB domain-containing protein [Spirochaetales bacterium]
MFSNISSNLGMPAQALSQFGYSLFDRPTSPSLASIGDDYVLGPGDSLILYLWGDPVDIKEISSSYTLTVDRNGFIFLPPAGQIAVWGQDLGTVKGVIKGMLSRSYKKLEMSLTLSMLRQFPVFVSGYAVNPGTVLATGVDTVMSILSRAGGIRKTGSLRTIVLARQGKNGAEKQEIDIYDSLIKGMSVDLRVREGDSLFVPGIGPVAALAGEVRRPGIYELKGETSIAKTLELAGGVLPSARSGGVTLLRFSETGKSLATGDLANPSFASKPASDGDFIYFGKVTDLLVGQTQISGPVKYAGRYDIASFKMLSSLLNKAQILPETNLFYGRVYRMDASGRDKSFAFSPRDVLSGSDIPLAEFDKVVLYRYDDVNVDPDFDHFPATVVVSGPVKYPGFYLYKAGSSIAGLLAANALTLNANPRYAEIVRRTASGREEYITFSPSDILSGGADIPLAPLDRVSFAKRGADAAAHDFNTFSGAVALTGQVAIPDVYASVKGLKLSNILTKDQILLDTNLNYAEITRLKADGKDEYLTFRPSEVLDGSWDFDLGSRDVVTLLKVGYSPETPDFDRFSSAVQVLGPTQFGGLYAWREGMKLSSLLAMTKPSRGVNQYYAEIVRPSGGDRFEYIAFAPREVASGVFDAVLQARDVVKLYASAKAAAKPIEAAAAQTAEPGVIGAAPAPNALPTIATPVATTPNQLPAPVNQAVVPPAAPAAQTNPLPAIPPAIAGTAAQAPAPAATVAAPVAMAPAVVANPAMAEAPAFETIDLASEHLNAVKEYVAVSGSVRYAGPYARTPSLKLSSIITSDQILEETNLDYAELTRLKADGSYEYLTFAPAEVLGGKFDLPLRARDSIRLVKKTAFGGTLEAANVEKFADIVQLVGQVARPEVFAFRPGMKLSALLTKDQVLLDTNLNYAEITRLKADGKNDYITFSPASLLSKAWDFDLGHRDMIKLFKVGYAPAKPDFDRFADAVLLTGPAQFGGLYAWQTGMKLSELLAKAKPALETNQVYAEIVRPLGGNKFEYQTFAPREIASGVFDLPLKAKDTVKLYTTVPPVVAKQGTETAPAPVAAVPTPSAPAALAAIAPAVPTAPAPAPATEMAGYDSMPGDLSRFLEVVTVSGSVRYVGPYARTPSLKLSSVVTPDQMLEETNLDYAELTRLKADGSYEYETFAPRDMLEGKYDLQLRARDSLRFVRKTDFGGKLVEANAQKYANLVQLIGQVARPEVFALRPGMKLSQVLTKDQILLDTNLNYAEVLRYKDDGKNQYITFRPAEVLNGTWDLDLASRDEVSLVKVGYAPAKPDFDRFSDAVAIQGPMQFAGLYAWREGMKLSSLLALAKPTLDANRYYAEIIRPLGGGRFEYSTFAPREVDANAFDMELLARDTVTLYTTAPALDGKQGAKAVETTNGAAPALIPAPANGEKKGVATESPAGAPLAAPAMAPPPPPADSVPVFSSATASESTDLGSFLEVVNVSGTIRYVGPYARTPSLMLSSVVTAEQMLENTNLEYAELTRLNPDASPEYLTFAPRDVLEGRFDLALKAKDSIRFVAKTAFGSTVPAANVEKFADLVQLGGQAARPEVYALRPGMKLSRILTKNQMLLDTNLNYAEIVRLKADGKNQYLTFRPSEVLAGTWDLDLGQRDMIRLVKVGYAPEKPDFDRFVDVVQVKGPVQFAGLYAWRLGMKLSDLQATASIVLETNQVYADITRPLSGGKNQVLTFAPREVASGEFDVDLLARDVVSFYSINAVKAEVQALGKTEPTATNGGAAGAQALGEAGTAAATGVAPGAAPAAGAATIGGAGTTAGAATIGSAAVGAIGAPGAGSSIATDSGFYLEVVNVSGIVRYEGPYARTPSLQLSSVVTADQILQDTNLDYAEITRRKADGSWEYSTFSPREVLSGKVDMALRAQDSIRFVKVGYMPAKPDFDHFGNAYAVTGVANLPGLYSISKPKMLSDIITANQMLSNTDVHYAEIERWVTGGRTEYKTFSPVAVLEGTQDERVFPRDIIRLVPAGDKGDTHDFSRYPDTILIKGTVRYPGRYAWYDGMKLANILSPDDLLIDTDSGYAEVRRQSAAAQTILSFSPQAVASGESELTLSSRDVVIFYPKYFNKPVTVSGEVAEPKVIPYYDGMELSAVLRSVSLSGNFISLKAVVTRAAGGSADVYLEEYFRKQTSGKVTLSPGDSISIKKLLPDEHLPVITVRGAVVKPQSLEFTDGMRLADALTAVGGFDSRAYPYGLVLIRKSAAEMQQKQVDRLIAQLEAASAAGAALPTSSDSTLSSAAAIVANLQIDLAMQRAKLGSLKQLYKEGFGRISLDMPATVEQLAASSSNVVLERDDLIYVPTTPTYVLVSGEVSDQSVVAYRDGMTVRQAIVESGWLSSEADISKAYIIRASGRLDSTEGKGFLFFRPNILNYTLTPGDTVVVPSKSVKVSVAWSYVKDGLTVINTILTGALTAKTLLGI